MTDISNTIREYFRLEISTSCSITLRKIAAKELPEGGTFEAATINISGGGLCFQSKRDLPANEILVWQFVIELPKETLVMYGEIAWKKPAGDQFQYGVKFLFFDESSQRELIQKLQLIQIRNRFKNKLIQQ